MKNKIPQIIGIFIAIFVIGGFVFAETIGPGATWFFSHGLLKPITTVSQILIGGTTTTTNAKLEVQGGVAITTVTSTFLTTDELGNIIATTTPVLTETDPIWTATSSNYFTLASWYSTTTDGLDEGITNLYYTDAKVQTALTNGYNAIFGNVTSTGYTSLATTTFAFDSMIGGANRYIKFIDYLSPVGGFTAGFNFPMIIGYDSASPVTGFGINQNLIIVSTENAPPTIFLGSDSSPNSAVVLYSTSTNELGFAGFSNNEQSRTLDGVILYTERLSVLSSSTDSEIYFSNSIENTNATILHNSSTDSLTFNDASSYTFDNNITVTGTTTADCFSIDGINCLTNTVESDPIWTATSSNYLTVVDAASTYLSQVTAASTYLTQATAASTYLTQAYASSTYGTMAYNSSTFLTVTDAASTYGSFTYNSSTFLTVTDAGTTYLTQSAAGTTYLSLASWFSTTTWPSTSFIVNGNMTSTGYTSLATTTFAFDSMIGGANRYIKFIDYLSPVG
ncbi:MAG: hypothetical protein PHV11_10460, partial [Candidatus Bipolaricaulis sp.]|nr:hypothetical protein [Candidatus Bipolaricaulis sp.]